MNQTTVSAPAEKISLYYRQGSSDKEYHASLEPAQADQAGDFVVNFAYGRRGGTLSTGTKTASPVDYTTAKKLYDKLIAEKTARGYSPGEAGTPYQQTPAQARSTGVLPQLLNPISEDQVQKLLNDPAWWCQEKYDGRRILIRRSGETIEGINRNGLVVSLPQPIVDAARQIGGMQWLMDGEMVGEGYVAFDVLEVACVNLRNQPYSRRMKALQKFVTGRENRPISLIDTATTLPAKRGMLEALQQAKREGIVFKRKDAVYTPGRPNSGGDQLKLKFVTTASCIVAGINGSKRSVRLQLTGAKGDPVPVGNVTISSGRPIPSAGAIVEVRYLYAYPGGSLFQPVYIGIREDLPTDACTVKQLKFKSVEEN